MGIWTGQAGGAGNLELGTPSGGGSFYVPAGPINSYNYGSSPAISLFDPSMLDTSSGAQPSPVGPGGASGWSAVVAAGLTAAGNVLAAKYLGKKDDPGMRAPATGGKGNLGSATDPTPGWSIPAFTTGTGKPGSPVGINPIYVLGAVGIAALILLMKRG